MKLRRSTRLSRSFAILIVAVVAACLVATRTGSAETQTHWVPGPPTGDPVCEVNEGEWYCRTVTVELNNVQVATIPQYYADDYVDIAINGAIVWNQAMSGIPCNPDEYQASVNLNILPSLIDGPNVICVRAYCSCGCNEANACILIEVKEFDDCPLLGPLP